MKRLIAPTVALAAILLAGCGAAPTMTAATTRQPASVGIRYLVIFLNDVKTTPAPAGAKFRFETITLSGTGSMNAQDGFSVKASLRETNGKVVVTLTRDGKPMTDKDWSFFRMQFRNTLSMGGPSELETAAITELLKWTSEPKPGVIAELKQR
jgi:hypothetical protein